MDYWSGLFSLIILIAQFLAILTFAAYVADNWVEPIVRRINDKQP